MIDLMNLQPHKISRDLSGYFTYIYGPPKAGKSTLASQYPSPLFLATERGYNALAGVYAIDITRWSDIKQVVRELSKQEIKDKFSTIVVDTVDRAASMCEKYICSQKGVDALNEVPYGGGWSALKKEFEDIFQSVAQLGYAIVFISHSKEGTFKRQDGSEFTQIYPSVSTSYNSIIENMADIYGYLHPIFKNGESQVVITLRSLDGSVRCGGRLKYIPPEINCSYESLVKALNSAIDKEAESHGDDLVIEEKNALTKVEELDFDELLNEFNSMINALIERTDKDEFEKVLSPKITHIVEKYLGKGKKINQCTRDQVEMIRMINSEIKEWIK